MAELSNKLRAEWTSKSLSTTKDTDLQVNNPILYGTIKGMIGTTINEWIRQQAPKLDGEAPTPTPTVTTINEWINQLDRQLDGEAPTPTVHDVSIANSAIIIENSIYSNIIRRSHLKLRKGSILSEYEIKLACIKYLAIPFDPLPIPDNNLSKKEQCDDIKTRFNIQPSQTGDLKNITRVAVHKYFDEAKEKYVKVEKEILNAEHNIIIRELRDRLKKEPIECLFYRGLSRWNINDFHGWLAAMKLKPVPNPYVKFIYTKSKEYTYPIQRLFGNEDELKRVTNIDLYNELYVICHDNDDEYSPYHAVGTYKPIRTTDDGVEYGYLSDKKIIFVRRLNGKYVGQIRNVDDIDNITFSDNYLLVSTSISIRLFDIRWNALKQIMEEKKTDSTVSGRSFSTDGNLLCIQTDDTTILIYSLSDNEPKLINTMTIGEEIETIEFIGHELRVNGIQTIYGKDIIHPQKKLLKEKILYDTFDKVKTNYELVSKDKRRKLKAIHEKRNLAHVKFDILPNDIHYPFVLEDDCHWIPPPIDMSIGSPDYNKMIDDYNKMIDTEEQSSATTIDVMDDIKRISSLDYDGVINSGETAILKIDKRSVILFLGVEIGKYMTQSEYVMKEDCFQETVTWFRGNIDDKPQDAAGNIDDKQQDTADGGRVYFCSQYSIYYIDFGDTSIIHQIRVCSSAERFKGAIRGFVLFGKCELIIFVEMETSPDVIQLIYKRGNNSKVVPIYYGKVPLYYANKTGMIVPTVYEQPTMDAFVVILPCIDGTQFETVRLTFEHHSNGIKCIRRKKITEMTNKRWNRISVEMTDDYYCNVIKGMNSKKYSLVVFGNNSRIEMYSLSHGDLTFVSVYSYRNKNRIQNFFWRWDPFSLIIVNKDHTNVIVRIVQNIHPGN